MIIWLSGESMIEAEKFVIRWAKTSPEEKFVDAEQKLLSLWASITQEIAVLYPHDVAVKQYCEYIYKMYGEILEGEKSPCKELLVRIEQLEDLIWALDLKKHDGS